MRYFTLFTTTFVLLTSVACAQTESLPPPVVHGNSFEVLSNSRYSVHSGFGAALDTQMLSNVLWAMNRVPMQSAYRELYVATAANVYVYDSVAHALTVHQSGDHRYNRTACCEIGIACDRDEEAGYAVQAGLLAAIAGWSDAGGNVVECPQEFASRNANSNWSPIHPIKMVDVFGQGSASGLKRTVQAVSSDSSLPLPRVDGPDTFELLVAGLRPDSAFQPGNLLLDELSQVLWAGYGVTPHQPIGKRGTTIPSAVAYYLLTRKIYVAREAGVERYNNRLPPGTDLTSSDHRLEVLDSVDRRTELRAACPRLPSTAAAYIVLCVDDTSTNWDLQEAGFAAFQYLMQAEQLGLGGFLTAPITTGERSAIITALGLPSSDQPAVVFSVGPLVTGAKESNVMPKGRAGLTATGGRVARFEYTLAEPATVRLAVIDLAGRTIRSWAAGTQTAGAHSLEWDGRNNQGSRSPTGEYFCRLIVGGGECQSARFVLTR